MPINTRFLLAAAAAGVLLAQPSARAAPVGKDAARCEGGGPALLVNLRGVKARRGSINLYLFNGPGAWLKSGQRVNRVNVPASAAQLDVCVAVPRPGTYALAVRHDINGSKSSDLNDGAGFSRNPKLSLTRLRPAFGQAALAVGPGVTRVPVVLQYRQGLSVGPIKGRG